MQYYLRRLSLALTKYKRWLLLPILATLAFLLYENFRSVESGEVLISIDSPDSELGQAQMNELIQSLFPGESLINRLAAGLPTELQEVLAQTYGSRSGASGMAHGSESANTLRKALRYLNAIMEVELIGDKQIRITASGLDQPELQRLLDRAVAAMEDFWTLKQTQQKRFLLARINQESVRLEQAQESSADVAAEAKVRLEDDRAMLNYLEQSPPTLQAASPSFSTSRKAPPDNLLLLAIALLLVGVAAVATAAFLVEISGPELVTERQIARVLQLPVYGKLPRSVSLSTDRLLE